MSIDSSSKLQFQETKEEEVDLRGDELHFHQEDCTTMHKPDQELVNNDDDDTLPNVERICGRIRCERTRNDGEICVQGC